MTESDNVLPAHSFTYEGAQINVYHADKGRGLFRHSHAYSHATMCCAGSLIVKTENKTITITKDTQPVNLVAGSWHELEAAEDGTVFVNVFAEGKY